MSFTLSKPKSDAKLEKKITFEYYAPSAGKVQLAGDFNGWKPAKTPLKKEKDGKWKVTLSLKTGHYQYRFWVDGDWQNDQKPVECAPNPFGTWNCVLKIS